MEKLNLTKPLNHVAFIMDGNGRWAKLRGLPRTAGHKAGVERIHEIADACKELNIKAMSLYAFSTENWNRPQDEIDFLFSYIDIFFKKYIKTAHKDQTRIIVSGDISRLPIKVQKTLNKAIEETKDYNRFYFNVCLNYGSYAELVKATKEIATLVKDNKLDINDINSETINNHLYTKDLPPVDLLIRTSGEMRLSNFMLFQLAYSEFIFTDTYWPDFSREEFIKCLNIYNNRNRRYGGLKNE